MHDSTQYEFIIGERPDHFSAAARLFKEYANGLGLDLSFQNFAGELNEIDVQCNLPSGGLVLIRYAGDFVGCAGIRRLDEKTAELKRMYIQPSHRGIGLGKLLMENAIAVAKERKYHSIKLDTLKSLVSALHLYRQFGFKDIEAYRFNPSDDVLYLEKQIL